MRPELAREVDRWLEKAKTDLDASRVLMTGTKRFPTVAAFLSQQAAEKSMKAFLTSVEKPFGPIHDLRRLCDLCAKQDGGFERFRRACEVLTPYAVSVRYPGAGPDVQDDEAQEAIGFADALLGFVTSIMPS